MMHGEIGHNSMAMRAELELSFKERTRAQRITENTPFDLRWQWEVWLSDLSPNGKLVAFAIRIFGANDGTGSRPSIDTIVNLTGLSRRCVIDQLKAIEFSLLMQVQKGKGRATSSYERTIPNKTIAELGAVISFPSGAMSAPREPRSGEGDAPQNRSSALIAPQAKPVAVQSVHHKSRSGANADRSGATGAPNITRDITKKESKKEPPVSPPSKKSEPKAAKRKKKSPVPDDYPNDFVEFWKVYPRREGKAKAFDSWDRLSMPQKRRAYVALRKQLPGLEAKMSDRQGNFCPMPSTWLNQGRFDDETQGAGTPPENGEHNGVWYLNGRPCTDKAEFDHWHGLLSAQ